MNINEIDYEKLILFVKNQEDIILIPDHVHDWLDKNNIDHTINDILSLIKIIKDIDNNINISLTNSYLTSKKLSDYIIHFPFNELNNLNMCWSTEGKQPVNKITIHYEVTCEQPNNH